MELVKYRLFLHTIWQSKLTIWRLNLTWNKYKPRSRVCFPFFVSHIKPYPFTWNEFRPLSCVFFSFFISHIGVFFEVITSLGAPHRIHFFLGSELFHPSRSEVKGAFGGAEFSRASEKQSAVRHCCIPLYLELL